MRQQKNILSYLLILILATLVLVKGAKPAWHTMNSDFSNYYVSAQLIANGEHLEKIYDNDWFQDRIRQYGINTPGKFAPFPLVTAFVMLPLTPFSPLQAQRVFLFVNLCFFAAAVCIIRKLTAWDWTSCILMLLLSGLALINNFAFGQLYLMMTVGVFVAIWLAKTDKIIPSAALLAVIAAIKYFAIVIIGAYMLMGLLESKKSIRESSKLNIGLLAIIFLVAIGIFQRLYFGEHLVVEYVKSVFIPHMGGDLEGQNPFSYQFQSWESLLRNVFIFDTNYNPNPYVASAFTKTLIMWLIRLAVLATSIFVLYKFRHRAEREAVYLSIPLLAVMVLSPASASYHFVILLIPVCLLASSTPFTAKERAAIVILFALTGFIPYRFFFSLSEIFTVLAFPRLVLITLLYGFVIWRLSSFVNRQPILEQ